MTVHLTNFVYYLVVLGFISLAISASIGVTSSAEDKKCKGVNRQPPSSSVYGCGPCLYGYTVTANHVCVSAPKSTACHKNLSCSRRKPCSEETKGLCGVCEDQYLDIDGNCLLEEEVKALRDDIVSLYKARSLSLSDGEEEEKDQQAAQPVVVSKKVSNDEKADAQEQLSTSEKPEMPAVDRSASVMGLPLPSANVGKGQSQRQIAREHADGTIGFNKLAFFGIVAGATLLCIISLIIAGVCWYRMYRFRKSMRPSEYMGYGAGDSPKKDSIARSDSSGDRKLAHSAQMYHYQHHKQQMLALEKSLSDKLEESDAEDPEELEDGNYTVYECPGLAPAGEMEVSNPLFQLNGSKITPPTTSPATTSPTASLASPTSAPSHVQSPTQSTSASQVQSTSASQVQSTSDSQVQSTSDSQVPLTSDSRIQSTPQSEPSKEQGLPEAPSQTSDGAREDSSNS